MPIHHTGGTVPRIVIRTLIAAGCVLPLGLALAAPVVNISPQRHPHLRSAQDFIAQAYAKLEDAQVANKYKLGGHANKAKELLEEASRELKLAAETANKNH
jgi:hypothetical protein